MEGGEGPEEVVVGGGRRGGGQLARYINFNVFIQKTIGIQSLSSVITYFFQL